MKKRASALIMAVIMVLTMIPAAFAEDEEQIVPLSSEWGSDYDDESETNFTISTVEELQAFATMVNSGKNFSGKTVTLENDLDLTGVAWAPIGKNTSYPFSGNFNGNSHIISNMTITGVTTVCGFFGAVKDANISDLTISNATITCTSYAGVLAGQLVGTSTVKNVSVSGSITQSALKGTTYLGSVGGIAGQVPASSSASIQNCTSSVSLSTSGSNVGGILGYGVGSVAIEACTNTGTVQGGKCTGGIVGSLQKGSVTGCSNSGDVTSTDRRCGGIVGDMTESSVEKCENSGAVSAGSNNEAGGIAGRVYAESTVTECINNGTVSGADSIGGIAGSVIPYGTDDCVISNCTNNGGVSGTSDVGGIAGTTSTKQTLSNAPTLTPSAKVLSSINNGSVSGSTNVGGIVGNHNDIVSDNDPLNNGVAPAEVSGCINTGNVSSDGGAIVGNNNAEEDNENGVGIVQNNFFPESVGTSAVGSGAGSASDDSDQTAVKNNSSYKEDGTLTTPVTNEEGNEVTTIADAVDTILGGTENAPEVLKVTATFDTNGHGTAKESITTVIGGTITLPSMDNDGYYTFLNWTANDITYAAGYTYTVTADVTFTANWRNDKPSSSGGGSSSSTTYSVSVDTAKNGTVSVSPKNASKGTTVTITAKPADGYEVDEVIVTDKNGDTVKVTAKGNDKYTFVMPAGKVDVEVTFVQEYVAPAISFTDVKSNAWYYDAALYAAENGLMSGTGNGAFSPDLTTSRAMIWTILARVDGQNISVTYGNWYDKAQSWAISAGVSDGTNPDNPITREQLAVMLYGFAKDQGYTTTGGVSLSRYVDASDVSSWAVEALEWAVGNGLISSMGNNILAPTGTATRAQVAVILMNFCENIAK